MLEAVLQAARAGVLRFHTPTHRGRVDGEYGAALGSALALDLTELDETDDLRDPRGAIAEAQALAAAHFGADRTWFLVNGASVGNCAALLAIARDGRSPRLPVKVIVGRNAHVSVINGLILADLEPVWVQPDWDAQWCVALPPSPQAYAAAIAAHPEARAVVVTAPTYFGDPADLAGIRAVAGDRVLIVDEAHGAHIPRALAAGADLVVHSAHKGLSGPTQGGYLHLGGNRVDPESVAAALRLLQSTSPNYWLLAGLDAARRQAAIRGSGQTQDDSIAQLLKSKGLEVRPTADPTRIVVRFPDGFSAYEASARAGVIAEAAMPGGVLFLAVDPTRAEEQALAEACDAVLREQERSREPEKSPDQLRSPDPTHRPASPNPPGSPDPGEFMPLRAAALAPREIVPVSAAVGRVCAEAICAYPPGVPILVPGEVATLEALKFIDRVAPGQDTIAVVRDQA